MTELSVWLEAERRGLLTPEKAAVLDQARLRGLVPFSNEGELAAQAAALNPTDIPIARSKNDPLGSYLRAKATAPRKGETPEQTDVRQYGKLSSDGNESPVAGTARSVLQGVTVGLGDEIMGVGSAIGAAASGEPAGPAYTNRVDTERARLNRFKETSPWIAGGAEVAGAIPTLMLAAPEIAVARTAPWLARTLAGAGTGAGQGAVYGFNAGENTLADRLWNSAKSGMIGGGIGAGVSGVVAPVVGAGARNLSEYLQQGRAAQIVGIPRAAYNAVTRAMSADDSLTGAGANRIRAAGTGAMIADAGPTARGLLDTAVQKGGPAAREAMTAIDRRAGYAGQDVNNALDAALGRPQGIATAETALRTSTAPARQAAYDAAYAVPINYADNVGRQIETVLTTRVPASALQEANALMRVNGERSAQILFREAADGTVTLTRMPDVRQLDYITRAINAVARRTDTAGAMGGQTPMGSGLQTLSRQLRGLMRRAVPEYGVALDTAAEPIAAREALQLGRDLLSPRIARDEVAMALDGMSVAERNSVAQGARSQIDEVLANVKRTLSNPGIDQQEAREAARLVRDLGSAAVRDKLDTLLGPRAQALFDTLDRAATALELKASVAQNSKTFARQSVDESVKAQTQDGVWNALRQGKPAEAGKRLVQMLTASGPARDQRLTDETYQAIVRVLTGPRGQDAIRMLQQLELQQSRIGPRAANRGKQLADVLSRLPAAAGPAQENLGVPGKRLPPLQLTVGPRSQ